MARSIDIISEATLVCSLFVLGASLTIYKISGHPAEAGLIVGLKLVIQPILTGILIFFVLDMDPLWGTVARCDGSGHAGGYQCIHLCR
jgi:malonate transporter